MNVTMQVNKTVNATTIEICAKCSDCFSASLKAEDGSELKDYDGYVPDFFPGQHFGDYIMLTIDLASGRILNWKPPTAEQIEAFIKDGSEP